MKLRIHDIFGTLSLPVPDGAYKWRSYLWNNISARDHKRIKYIDETYSAMVKEVLPGTTTVCTYVLLTTSISMCMKQFGV